MGNTAALDTSAEQAPEGCRLLSTKPSAREPSTEYDRCEMDPPTRSSNARQRLVFQRNSKFKNSQNYFFSPENLPESKDNYHPKQLPQKTEHPSDGGSVGCPQGEEGSRVGRGSRRGRGWFWGCRLQVGCAWSPVRGKGGGLQGHNMHLGRG